jgi:hypothetical protein
MYPTRYVVLPSSYSRSDATRAIEDFDGRAADVLRSNHRTFAENLRVLIAFERRDPLFAHLFATELKLTNFDSWFFAINSDVGARIGRGTLRWPDDEREKLYLQTVLLTRIAEGAIDLLEFCYTFISGDARHDVVLATFNTQLAGPYFREYRKVAVQIANTLSKPTATQPPGDTEMRAEDALLDIFISHSSSDEDLARAMIDLLCAALALRPERIRCTSVEGFKLPIGVDSDNQIRIEVLRSKVLVGLLTPYSLESSYVLFELGARWGKDGFIAPLLAKGSKGSVLRGPIAGFNALPADKPEDLKSFIRDLAKKLSITAKPEVEYEEQLGRVVAVSLDGDIWRRFEGKRVKAKSDYRKEQFYVFKRSLHYLTLEAALVCEEHKMSLHGIDEVEERILRSSIGESFDAALMRGALPGQNP